MSANVRSGTVLAGFRIESLIGQGAMGDVYLAGEISSGERVALKLLSRELSEDERFRQRFMREAEIAASLDDPHVVRILRFGEEDGRLYLAMAYVDGLDLRELLRREGRLEPERALGLLVQVAAALDTAHRAGLVHRDVKPGNILVAGDPGDESAYICDFGLARHLSTASSLTGDRGFVGTIDYVPPEQIAGQPIDRRADVYSLGCVLYECLTGARPFEHESELALIYAHLNDVPPRVTDLSPELPAALDEVIAVALAKEPDERYASCGELVAAAQAALSGKRLRRRSRGRLRWIVAAAAVLVAAAAAVVAYVATRGDAPAASPPAITQTSIGGAMLGGLKATYTKRFGAYKQLSLTEFPPPIPGVSFGQPQVAVYFKADPKRGDIITTWNRRFRTAAGVGPCSTIAELEHAYGDAVHPSPHAISPDGTRVSAYVVGRNLLFSTQDQRTISVVALYRGAAINTRKSDQQGWANFVAAVETPCRL